MVRNLDEAIDDRELQANLMFYGEILDIKVLRSSPPVAFVTFDNEDAAKLAASEMDRLYLNGQTISVSVAQPNELE